MAETNSGPGVRTRKGSGFAAAWALAVSGAVIAGLLLAAPTSAAPANPAPAEVTLRNTPAVSVKAPLPKSAYRGLACNPFTKRLRKTALPNGVGPEARVAAACMRLEWRKRGKAPIPPITVHRSPTYPKRFVEQLERGAAAGHRLFGRFADVESYELFASADANYSCREGKKLVDARAVFPPWFGLWESGYNTGCPGTDYTPGGWTTAGLGDRMQIYFAWTLVKGKDAYMFNDTSVLGPTFFGTVSHEFVHNIQMQRALIAINGQESIGRWFDEGQAQYLGNTAAAFSTGPADIRSVQLQQLRRVMRQQGVTRIDLASMANDWQSNVVNPAGYFAYEWLVAHYGLDATFDWLTTWNTNCDRPGSDICWRTQAQEMFGMSGDQLLATIDEYVNRQLGGR